ncbi:MAG: hypothetical protein RQ715_10655 [Methylococcales bacterium]|nr:hypothetical protein [Methylococcales bacterium]
MGQVIGRWLILLSLSLVLTGCLYWLRAYDIYTQLEQFDVHFVTRTDTDFTLEFKKPVLFSQDLVSLSGMRPSQIVSTGPEQNWHYQFVQAGKRDQPAHFAIDAVFNRYGKLRAWHFSKPFLTIAPPDFLAVSLRSLAGAEIDEIGQRLNIDERRVQMIDQPLVPRHQVIAWLGAPDKTQLLSRQRERLTYLFMLDDPQAANSEPKYSQLQLTFDQTTDELIKLKAKFDKLKFSIKYRRFQASKPGLQALDQTRQKL